MLTRLTSSQQVLLLWIALVVMTLDHFVLIFHDSSHWIHYLSRFVFPVFAYLVVYNYHFRTSNKSRYMGRLLLWACISQPIYSWSLDLDLYKLNILFTLFFGLGFLHGHNFLKHQLHSYHELALVGYFSLFLVFMGLGILASYYWFGLALLTTFALYFSYPSSISLVCVAINIVLLNLITGNLVQGLYGLSFFLIVLASAKITEGVSIPRLSGWMFYAYYPAHLLILGVLRYVVIDLS